MSATIIGHLDMDAFFASVEEYEVRSTGEQETFANDTKDAYLIGERLKAIAAGVIEKLSKV